MFENDNDQDQNSQSDDDQGDSSVGDENTSNAGEGNKGSGENDSSDDDMIEYVGKKYTPKEFKVLMTEKFLPDYTKKATRLKELEGSSNGAEGSSDDKELAEARGRAFKLLEPDIRKMVDEVYSKRDQDKMFGDRMKSLAKEIDGRDGRPPFVPAEIVKFAAERNLGGDPEDIYELAKKKELRNFYMAQGQKGKPNITFSEKPGAGIKLPKGKDYAKMSDDEFRQAGVEFLEKGGE